MDALKQDSRVVLVGGNGRFYPCAQMVPSGVIRMGITNFPLAHINGVDERINVDVAVLDGGIQTNHPDLNVVHAVDCTGSGIVDDQDGHGTHVAGIIGALDNGFGVVGVAPGARLWSVRVLEASGYGSTSMVLAGLDYIAQNADEIEVVNASLDRKSVV